MADQQDGRTVVDVPERARYELRIGDDVVGEVTYRRDGDQVVLEHTEVDRERRERGLGTDLARGALDDLRARGIRVVPQCPFIASFVQRNPEYADLVA